MRLTVNRPSVEGELILGRSDEKKNVKKSLDERERGPKTQHHCRGGRKHQEMVTTSTQTQYGGKYDGRCHS